MTPINILLVALGGALGALARYGVGLVVADRFGTFPWATFIINATGSLLLGLTYKLIANRVIPGTYIRPFFGIGFIGAYTTFSTFEYESASLRSSPQAYMNLFGSVIVGYACVWIGFMIADLITKMLGLVPEG